MKFLVEVQTKSRLEKDPVTKSKNRDPNFPTEQQADNVVDVVDVVDVDV